MQRNCLKYFILTLPSLYIIFECLVFLKQNKKNFPIGKNEVLNFKNTS